MRLDDKDATSSLEKAELFNQCFHSVLSAPTSKSSLSKKSPKPSNCLHNITLDSSDTNKALASLDPSKAMGVDKLPPKILKSCVSSLYEPINHLFQLSLDKSYIPAEWKKHLITPIHKSGDRSMINNYRPISLLCAISKVLESLIYNGIIDFVSKAINESQFGFLRGKSTIHQLLVFLNDITNRSSHVGATSAKPSTAYPTVSYSRS